MKNALFLFALALTQTVWAQNSIMLKEVSPFYSKASLQSSHFSASEIISNQGPITSIQLESEFSVTDTIQVICSKLELGYDTFYVFLNFDENKANGSKFTSNLLVFKNPQTKFRILSNQVELIVHALHAPELKLESNHKLLKKGNACDKPTMISYTFWRQGLPDPKPPRETTEVEHLVVHHSAGSNTDTNYLNIVRNIYLLHTQTNGWDDIGYNFLVAPNGLVFNGRDPQGAGDEDNILGAHFCSKNTNTMGVCMLGNFMLVMPKKEAVHSLNYLLAWKLKKDEIDGNGATVHPQVTGTPLANICGHRDGCNTSCPGDSLYSILINIRKEAVRIADSCGLVINSLEVIESFETRVYYHSVEEAIFISGLRTNENDVFSIFTLDGRRVFISNFMYGNKFNLFLPKGLYLYKIEGVGKKIIKGKIYINLK